MKDLKENICAEVYSPVNEEMLAVNVGSGSLEVLATPAMIALMEKAACKCLGPFLENDETTVGTEMNIRHTSATPPGMNITARAELSSITGREFTFKVTAEDDAGLIGEGVHKRFLVYGEKFTAKAKSKLP